MSRPGEVPGSLKSLCSLLIWRANQKTFQLSSLLLSLRLALPHCQSRTNRIMKSVHMKFAEKMFNIVFSFWEKNYVERTYHRALIAHIENWQLQGRLMSYSVSDNLTVQSLQEYTSPDMLIFSFRKNIAHHLPPKIPWPYLSLGWNV